MSVTTYTSKVARGAACELIAAAHLMAEGYHVFRALAATCPVDMIAWKLGEDPLRVEVKSGHIGDRYNPVFPRPNHNLWDLLAIVTTDGRVAILPRRDDLADVKDEYFDFLGIPRAVRAIVTDCRRGHDAVNIVNGTCRVCTNERNGGYRNRRAFQKSGIEDPFAMDLL